LQWALHAAVFWGPFRQCKWIGGRLCLNAGHECIDAPDPWKPVLQYDVAYTPSTAAVLATSVGTQDGTDAKLSDVDINAIGTRDADGYFYYKLEAKNAGLESTRTKSGYTQGQKFDDMVLFMKTTGTFVDTSVGWGLKIPQVCNEKSLEECNSKAAWKTTNNGASGIDLMRIYGDECERYLTDYAGRVGCFPPGFAPAGQRCVAQGIGCSDSTGSYRGARRLLMSKYSP